MKALSMLAMAAIAHATPEMNKLPNGDTKVCMFWRAGVGFGGAGERVMYVLEGWCWVWGCRGKGWDPIRLCERG
jgi:hypothetical protein